MRPTHRIGGAVAAVVIGAFVVWRLSHRAPVTFASVAQPLALASDMALPEHVVGTVSRPLPAISDWCARLARSNAQAIATHSTHAGCTSAPLDCITDDAGATWGFSIDKTRESSENGTCTTDTSVDIVRGAAEARVSGPDAGLSLSLSGDRGGPIFQTDAAHLTLLGDYDGDGDQEVLVTRSWWAHEGGSGNVSSVWTFKGGAVMPYAPAKDFVIDGYEDIDRDGRVDFLTAGPYTPLRGWAAIGYDYPIGPAIFIEHALADGTFSMTDAVAVAFTQGKCAAHELQPNASIVCDRLRGKSESDVIGGLKKTGCVDFLGDLQRYPASCDPWMVKAASTAPPFRF